MTEPRTAAEVAEAAASLRESIRHFPARNCENDGTVRNLAGLIADLATVVTSFSDSESTPELPDDPTEPDDDAHFACAGFPTYNHLGVFRRCDGGALVVIESADDGENVSVALTSTDAARLARLLVEWSS